MKDIIEFDSAHKAADERGHAPPSNRMRPKSSSLRKLARLAALDTTIPSLNPRVQRIKHDEIEQRYRRRAIFARQKHREKFMWHEQVIHDPTLSAAALRYAGLVMHHRHIAKKGYITISITKAAKQLGLSPSATLRARDRLIKRGWLHRLDGPPRATARYAIGAGPLLSSTLVQVRARNRLLTCRQRPALPSNGEAVH